MNQVGGPLRAVRAARRWSQARAAKELAALALARGMAVAAPASLKTQLSRWENQHAVPEEHYRTLLCALYESTESELGLVEQSATSIRPEQGDARLRAELAESATLDNQGIALLRAQLRATRRLDHRLGTAATEGSVHAQLSYLERVLAHAINPHVRRELAYLVVDGALLAGEHSLDQLRSAEAWRQFETARTAAQETGSAALASYAMVQQASILVELGEHRSGVELVEHASNLTEPDVSSPLLAWFSASRGHALAVGGASEPARSAYRLAELQLGESAGTIDIVYPELRFLNFDLPALRRHRGHARLMLHEDDAAINDLEQALEMDGVSARDVAGIHVDLAHAHGAAGHAASAAEHAGQAREIVSRIGSSRLAHRLNERHPSDAAAPRQSFGSVDPAPTPRTVARREFDHVRHTHRVPDRGDGHDP
jgi:transcriptional regulator with XRE-family HTH domain